MNLSSCWSANTGVSMYWILKENITYKFFLTSPAVPNISYSSYLDGCEIWDKWPCCWCFIGCFFQDSFKTVHSTLVELLYSFYSWHFIKLQLVQPCNSNDTATALKQSHSILDWFDFFINWSIAINPLPMHILTSLSVDGILLPRYMNVSTKYTSDKYLSNFIFGFIVSML